MSKQSIYKLNLCKIVSGSRNIDCFYIVLLNDKTKQKLISKPMRNDEDNEDQLHPQKQIKPNIIQLWNYDKMKIVDRYTIDFKKNNNQFLARIYQENIEIKIEKIDPWKAEILRSGNHGFQKSQSSTVKQSRPILDNSRKKIQQNISKNLQSNKIPSNKRLEIGTLQDVLDHGTSRKTKFSSSNNISPLEVGSLRLMQNKKRKTSEAQIDKKPSYYPSSKTNRDNVKVEENQLIYSTQKGKISSATQVKPMIPRSKKLQNSINV